MSMDTITPDGQPVNTNQVFTREEVENIIRDFERAKVQKREERYKGNSTNLG